nr:aldehyde dehydrogenase family protein [Staphylococcus aureus]
MTINKVTVLGAGTMGAQLAALFVNAGLKVKLLDIVVDKNDPNLIAKKSYDKITDKKRPLLFDLNLVSHLTYGNFDDDLVNDDADLYIEAVKEDIEIKHAVWQQVLQHAKEDALFATNTSGIPINAIAQAFNEKDQERFFGLHFFNPPRIMKLVELIPTSHTKESIILDVKNFAQNVLGKGVIVVDENIDTDMAAEAIVTSAFGFSGQKCSACSRAIVHKDVYDEVLEKSIKLTKELTLGNTVDNTYMGPVINKKQFDKIKNYIEIGKEEGKLEQGGGTDDSKGYFVEPTIISGLKSKDRIMQEEIFGPVVGFVKVNDFDEAIEVANDTDYGLTGAVITNNREHWIKAVNEFDVGNLYLNRGCTSAVVGYHPFGGFKMSGTDAKTGSPDYLLHFLEQKVVSEMF